MTNLQSSFRGRRSDEWDNLISSVKSLIDNLSEEVGKSVKLAADDFNPLVIPYRYHRIVKDVIVQLIRNSIVHGIEDPDERKAAKKDPEGVIKIGSRIDNGFFELKYKDDGRGLQIDKMRNKAISMGKWDESTIKSWKDSQIASLIFQPGFSTAEKVDMGAGRGVGMDIIHQRVSEFGGKIKVLFVPGKYCEFKILLPEEQNLNETKNIK